MHFLVFYEYLQSLLGIARKHAKTQKSFSSSDSSIPAVIVFSHGGFIKEVLNCVKGSVKATNSIRNTAITSVLVSVSDRPTSDSSSSDCFLQSNDLRQFTDAGDLSFQLSVLSFPFSLSLNVFFHLSPNNVTTIFYDFQCYFLVDSLAMYEYLSHNSLRISFRAAVYVFFQNLQEEKLWLIVLFCFSFFPYLFFRFCHWIVGQTTCRKSLRPCRWT